jgi:glycosyltransferase involved in cell wall biosynthesis
MAKARLFIVMPAYKAARKIRSVFDRIAPETWKKIQHVIIVVDGDADGTLQQARDIRESFGGKVTIVYHPQNRGYGRAQKTGYAEALRMGADICALLHSDGQYAPELLPQLLKPLENGEADVVMGSRMLDPSRAREGEMPLYKFLANKFLTFIENRVYGLKMSEYHSGYMLYRREVLETIPFEKLSDRFHFDGEMLMLSCKNGFRVKEISIPTQYGDEERILNPITYGFEVLNILAAYLSGKYKPMIRNAA